MLQLILQTVKILSVAAALAVIGTHYLLQPMPGAVKICSAMAVVAILLSQTPYLSARRSDQS